MLSQQLFHAALRTAAACFLELLPAHRRSSGIYFHHADTARHRTNQRTKIAADTLVVQYLWNVLGQYSMTQIAERALFDPDALVGAIFTCDVAKIAAVPLPGITLANDLIVEIAF